MIIVLRYVKSRSDQQLLHRQEYTHTSACKLEESSNGLPVVPCGLIAWSMLYDTNFSRERTKLKEYTHTSACKLEESSNGLPVVPCGLIAWSMLYDTNFSRERTKLKVSRNDTAWKSDHEHKFGKNVFPFNFQNGTLISGPKLDPKVTWIDEAYSLHLKLVRRKKGLPRYHISGRWCLFHNHIHHLHAAPFEKSEEYTHTSACKPEESSNGLPVVPCGLIAWSMLYDTNFSRGRTKLKASRNDTAWKSDHEHKFGKNVFPFNFQNGTLISGPKLDPKVTVCILNHYYHRYQ
ncbi:hypothetical protein F2Q69_00055414 [Brassica cretica]|uniref:Uncharacterized protein n=1 Tax=Brassica cretica TaxID=69181 RepID=A0A8S9MYS4_BRACR|nr:hypothetical protein F2Q69_00055414 [Brassica cretica]